MHNDLIMPYLILENETFVSPNHPTGGEGSRQLLNQRRHRALTSFSHFASSCFNAAKISMKSSERYPLTFRASNWNKHALRVFHICRRTSLLHRERESSQRLGSTHHKSSDICNTEAAAVASFSN